MTEVAELIAQTERALSQLDRERALAVEQHRRELDGFRREEDRLKQSLRALRGRRTRTAAGQAGARALAAVLDALAAGPRTQVQLARETGLDASKVSYALKALREDGRVELTGETIDGSRELRVASKQAAAA